MTKTTLLSILVVPLFLLSNCSERPSNEYIEEQVVEYLLSDGADDYMRIENFEKTNGLGKDDGTYIAYVKYDIVFKKSLKEMNQELKKTKDPLEKVSNQMAIAALSLTFGSFKAGERIKEEDEVIFIKTENGWLISRP